jgi:hypothetical protein
VANSGLRWGSAWGPSPSCTKTVAIRLSAKMQPRCASLRIELDHALCDAGMRSRHGLGAAPPVTSRELLLSEPIEQPWEPLLLLSQGREAGGMVRGSPTCSRDAPSAGSSYAWGSSTGHPQPPVASPAEWPVLLNCLTGSTRLPTLERPSSQSRGGADIAIGLASREFVRLPLDFHKGPRAGCATQDTAPTET